MNNKLSNQNNSKSSGILRFTCSPWLLIAVLLSGVFVLIASMVIAGETTQLDRLILLSLRNPHDLSDPLGAHWFEELMRDATALGGTGILSLITLATVMYLYLQQNKSLAWFLIVAIGSGMLMSSLLKYGFARPRPDLVPHGSYVYTSSFPSGHSMMSALVYFTIGAMFVHTHDKRSIHVFLVSVAVFIVVLIGLSRIYLGVHWPSDVLAGWCAGSLWALLSYRLIRYWQKQGKLRLKHAD